MFIIPLGIMRGADITISQMFTKSIIPVTLGNIVGGGKLYEFCRNPLQRMLNI
jgi:formate/nitrite transporter FocA (FNT family)